MSRNFANGMDAVSINAYEVLPKAKLQGIKSTGMSILYQISQTTTQKMPKAFFARPAINITPPPPYFSRSLNNQIEGCALRFTRAQVSRPCNLTTYQVVRHSLAPFVNNIYSLNLSLFWYKAGFLRMRKHRLFLYTSNKKGVVT